MGNRLDGNIFVIDEMEPARRPTSRDESDKTRLEEALPAAQMSQNAEVRCITRRCKASLHQTVILDGNQTGLA